MFIVYLTGGERFPVLNPNNAHGLAMIGLIGTRHYFEDMVKGHDLGLYLYSINTKICFAITPREQENKV